MLEFVAATIAVMYVAYSYLCLHFSEKNPWKVPVIALFEHPFVVVIVIGIVIVDVGSFSTYPSVL